MAAAAPAPQRAPQAPAAPARPTGAKKEDRIFLRAQGEAAKHHPYEVRKAVNRITSDAVKEVQRVPSGFALVPRGQKEARTILENAKKIDALFRGKTEAT